MNHVRLQRLRLEKAMRKNDCGCSSYKETLSCRFSDSLLHFVEGLRSEGTYPLQSDKSLSFILVKAFHDDKLISCSGELEGLLCFIFNLTILGHKS